MVKTLAALVGANVVLLLEVAGVVLIMCGLGMLLGPAAVCIGTGVAVLGKSVELDVTRKRPPT